MPDAGLIYSKTMNFGYRMPSPYEDAGYLRFANPMNPQFFIQKSEIIWLDFYWYRIIKSYENAYHPSHHIYICAARKSV